MTKKIGTILLSTLISGFAAQAAKPDFAYPKEVSKSAGTELKAAMKRADGPATVRALMNVTLADGLMNPDDSEALEKRVAGVAAKISDPVTEAMTMLLRADVTGKPEWADSALTAYTGVLRHASVTPWREVLEIDSVYCPTLYDFAVARRLSYGVSDSLLSEVRQFHADDPAPLCYWTLNYNGKSSEALALYDRFRTEWVSYYPLVWLSDWYGTDGQKAELYDMASDWITTHSSAPHYAIDQVKNMIGLLTRPSVELRSRNLVKLGDTLKVEVTAANVNDVVVGLYRTKPDGAEVARVKLNLPGKGYFRNDTVVSFVPQSFGEYQLRVLTPSDGSKPRRDYGVVAVSDLMVQIDRFGQNSEYFALDPVTGMEQTGVDFKVEDRRLYARRGDDRFSPGVWYNGQQALPAGKWENGINILTDRSIYHPGDTVQFVLTAYRYKGYDRREICSGEAVTVDLLDVNRKKVASVTGVTDGLGRVAASLPIPSDGLTGYYMIESDRQHYGSAQVMVSDYTAPKFEVSLTSQRLDSVTVELSGSAVDYSGFPVQEADVKITVDRLEPWVWYRNYLNGVDREVADTLIRTDSAGHFRVKIALQQASNLMATAAVTSALGETHEDKCFIPLKRYFIQSKIPADMQVPGSPGWKPAVAVVDADGQTCDVPLVFTLISGNDTITSVTDWNRISSGRYSLLISTEEPGLAFDVRVDPLIIYRLTDRMPPVESPLWLPMTSVSAGESILLGTSFDNERVRYVLWTPDSIIEKKWITLPKGNRMQKVTLPDGVNSATLTLWTVRNYELIEKSVAVTRHDAVTQLNVEISSMRDKVQAGDRELWTIRITDNLGNPVESSAVVLDVYSKALDALMPHSLRFYPRRGSSYWFNTYPGSAGHVFVSSSPGEVSYPRLPSSPNIFQTYGERWPREHAVKYYVRGRGAVNSGMMMKAEMTMYDSAAMDEAEVEVEEAAMTSGAADMGSGSADGAAEKADYRLPEVPLALWQPVLTTGADGVVQVQFVAPDANTTWAVRTLAYDRSLLTGNSDAEIVASKPVMVQTSLPRFLRQGDRIQLRSSAVNNTDSESEIRASIEIYDPMTGKVLHKAEYEPQLMAPMSSRRLDMDLTVGDNATLVGVRVRAASGNFSDGEQTVIPVLPSAVTVTESTPILMAPDSASLVIDARKGSVVTVTSNAVWECVTALPGLIGSEGSSSVFGSVARLFAASVADGLVRSYPEIGRALRSWAQSDSVLVSRLAKDEDLRIALLSATLWVGVSETESERMARLTLLLDKKQTRKVIDGSVAEIAKFVKSGGFCWIESEKPSLWATINVLTWLGRLKHMGYLPSHPRMAGMIAEAVKYADTEVARRYASSNEKINTEYVAMRDLFPDIAVPSTARKVIASTIQHYVADWRKLSLRGKAEAALILNRNGYHTTAMRITESLRQYGAWKQTGITSSVLRAFATVEPGCDEVDEIRMWLLSRKRTMDWGTGMQASEVLWSLLTTGSDWLVPAANQISIKVNGVPVDADMEAFTGAFRLDLPEGGRVEVNKGRFPAWGGVWTRYDAEADSVSELGVEGLTLSRSVDGDMSVGSRVTVTLTVKTDRPLDYVVVESPRCAGLQPISQLPYNGMFAYVEPTSTATTFYLRRLPKGRTELVEEFYVTAEGEFLLAPAQVQSQYAPEYTATSSGSSISIE